MRPIEVLMGAALAFGLGACDEQSGGGASDSASVVGDGGGGVGGDAGTGDSGHVDGAVSDGEALDAAVLDAAALDFATDDATPGDADPADGEVIDARADLSVRDAEVPDATPCEPQSESCNALDDDCDGQTDEALTVACGSEEGRCLPGLSTCVDGSWGPCDGAIDPADEQCNGLDDDCDGVSDELPLPTVAPLASEALPRLVITPLGARLLQRSENRWSIQALDDTGAAVGPPLPAGDEAVFGQPDLVWDGQRLVMGYVLSDGLWVARFTAAGVPIDRRRLGEGRYQNEWVALAAVPGGYLAIVTGSAGIETVYRFDDALNHRAAPTTLRAGARQPSLASNGQQVLAVWTGDNRPTYTRLDLLGNSLQPARTLRANEFSGSGPVSVTVAPTGFAVAWSQFVPGPASAVGFARISNAGQVIGSPLLLEPAVAGEHGYPSLVSQASSFLLAWSRGPSDSQRQAIVSLSPQGTRAVMSVDQGDGTPVQTGKALVIGPNSTHLLSRVDGSYQLRSGALEGCPLPATPVRAPGALCDPTGLGDHCDPRGGPCTAQGRCPVATAPSIVSAGLTYNPRTTRLRAQVSTDDAQGDVLALLLTPADAEGNPLGDPQEAGSLARTNLSVGRENSVGATESWPAEAGHAWVVARDSFGLESARVLSPVLVAPERAQGEVCDATGETDWCSAGYRCWENDFDDAALVKRCVVLPEGCGADQQVLDLNQYSANYDLPEWTAYAVAQRGSDFFAPVGPGCGPQPVEDTVERLLTFVAPEAGTYGFEVTPNSDLDPHVIEVRRSCGEADAEQRLSCDVQQTLATLAAGERVFIAVRLPLRAGGVSQELFEIRAYPAGPVPQITAAEALLELHTALLGIHLSATVAAPDHRLKVEVLDADGRAITRLLPANYTTPIVDLDPSPEGLRARVTLPILRENLLRPEEGDIGRARAVRLVLQVLHPETNQLVAIGPAFVQPIAPTPRLNAGEPCDTEGGAGLCPPHHACLRPEDANDELGRCDPVPLPAVSACPAHWPTVAIQGGSLGVGGQPEPPLQPSPCGGMGATSVVVFTSRVTGTLVAEAHNRDGRFPIPVLSLQRSCNDPTFEHLLACSRPAQGRFEATTRAAMRVLAGDVVYVHTDYVAPSRRELYSLDIYTASD